MLNSLIKSIHWKNTPSSYFCHNYYITMVYKQNRLENKKKWENRVFSSVLSIIWGFKEKILFIWRGNGEKKNYLVAFFNTYLPNTKYKATVPATNAYTIRMPPYRFVNENHFQLYYNWFFFKLSIRNIQSRSPSHYIESILDATKWIRIGIINGKSTKKHLDFSF